MEGGPRLKASERLLATLIVLTLGGGVTAAILKDTTPMGSIAQPTGSATFTSPAATTSTPAPATSSAASSPTQSTATPSATRTEKPEVPEMPRTGVGSFMGLGIALLALGYLLGRYRRAPGF